MSASFSKICVSAGIGIALLTSAAGFAHATTANAFSGVNCKGVNATEQAKIAYDPYGVANVSGSTATVECPITTTQGGIPTQNVFVKIYDRSNTEDIACDLDYQNQTGAAFVGGHGTIAAGAGSSPTSFGISAFQPMWGAVLYCTIPAATGSGLSYISAYHITSNP